MRGKIRFILTTAVLLSFFAASTASADFRTDPYVGAGFGLAGHDGCEDRFLDTATPPPGADLSSTQNFCADVVTAHAGAAKGFVGFRFHDLLAVEFGYYDLGTSYDDDWRLNSSRRTFGDRFDLFGGAFSVLAILPVDEGSQLFFRVGGFFGGIEERDPEVDGSPSGVDGYFFDEHGVSFLAGVGGEFKIGPMFSLRGEVEWIPNVGDGRASNEEPVNGSEEPSTADIDVVFASVSLVWHFMGAPPNKAYIDTCAACEEEISTQLGFYIGGGGLMASFDGGEKRTQFDTFQDNISDIQVGGRGFAGYRFHKYLAAELGYSYFNIAHDDDNNPRNPQAGPDTFEAQGLSGSVLAIFPVFSRSSVFAKVGIFYGFLEERDTGNWVGPGGVVAVAAISDHPPHIQFTEDGASILVGAGMNWDLTRHISLRGEVEFIPNIGQGTREYGLNPPVLGDQFTHATGEVDILSSSLSFVWNFR